MPIPFDCPPMILARGPKVALRRAAPTDRFRLYEWITQWDLPLPSDVNAEVQTPSYREFCDLYGAHLFSGALPFAGRALIAESDGKDVGFVRYGEVRLLTDVVEVDVALAARRYCGHGYGSSALALMAEWLQAEFGVNRFLARPSRRNVRALRALRRAGFREINVDAGEVLAKLALPPGRYPDEALLFKTLPTPRADLLRDERRTYVFFDSEFTNLEDPALISVGAVATDSTAFYCEIKGWPAAKASDFVSNVVVPLLDGDAVPLPMARAAFNRWLADRMTERQVTIVCDSGFDRRSLVELLGAEDLPGGAQWLRVPVSYAHLDDVAQALGLRRHHALDDARALRHALLNGQG